MAERRVINGQFGTADVFDATLTTEDVFSGNVSRDSPATLDFSQGDENGRLLHTLFVEDHDPGARPPSSLMDVVIDGEIIGKIDPNEDPHYYFEGLELNNKSFGVRTVQVRPNTTFGSSTIDVIAKYFYK